GGERSWQAARYAAWIIPPAGKGEIQVVDLGLAEEIDALIDQVRQEMNDAGKREGVIQQLGEPAAEKKLREIFVKVTERVWQPLAQHLPNNTERLILSPDGALWLLPWNALPLEENRFLVEDFCL